MLGMLQKRIAEGSAKGTIVAEVGDAIDVIVLEATETGVATRSLDEADTSVRYTPWHAIRRVDILDADPKEPVPSRKINYNPRGVV